MKETEQQTAISSNRKEKSMMVRKDGGLSLWVDNVQMICSDEIKQLFNQ